MQVGLYSLVFSLPGQSPGRVIVLPPASALASALALAVALAKSFIYCTKREQISGGAHFVTP